MILYLIKNNFKLMFRNKWILGMMIIGPIIVIAMLSSVFKEVMKSYEGVNEFTVGYRFAEESIFESYVEEMKDAGKDVGITFLEFPSQNVKEALKEGNCHSFVEFFKNSVTIYKVEGYVTQGMTTEFFFDKLLESFASKGESGETIDIPVKQLSTVPKVEAEDYYGIIYIVYFTWCCYVSISAVLISEKRNRIEKKFKVAPVSEAKLYLAKCIPCVLVTLCEMTITIIVTTLLYDIHWGNYPITVLIICLMTIAATMFGLLFMYLFRNLAVAIVVSFVIVWFAGYVGGSFEAYYFSPISESIKLLSPIYHIDRTLVEFSAVGQSDYAANCIAYLLILSTICFVAGLGIAKIRKVDVT